MAPGCSIRFLKLTIVNLDKYADIHRQVLVARLGPMYSGFVIFVFVFWPLLIVTKFCWLPRASTRIDHQFFHMQIILAVPQSARCTPLEQTIGSDQLPSPQACLLQAQPSPG